MDVRKEIQSAVYGFSTKTAGIAFFPHFYVHLEI